MKIHFVTGLEGNQDDFLRIVKKIQDLGHELVTDHFLTRTISDLEQEAEAEAELYDKKSMQWFKRADIVVFECTYSNSSQGYELATAMNLMKPVIVLYRKGVGESPYRLRGMTSDKLQVLSYDDTTLEEVLEAALEYASDSNDIRFNFFISSEIFQYLDWISSRKKIPRSVYIRRLIEDDMHRNEEYSP